jgi:hypothetical protein
MLFGEENATEKIPLLESLGKNKDPFEQGNVDIFEVITPRLGPLTKIR